MNGNNPEFEIRELVLGNDDSDFSIAEFDSDALPEIDDHSELTEEQDSERELSEYFQSLKKESRSYENRNNSNYWCAIVFDTQRQRDEFIAAAGWNIEPPFIDGPQLAKKMGIELSPGWKVKIPPPDKKYAELALVNQTTQPAR